MNTIKKFLTMIDIFGINFTFRYKDKERYQTTFGGFIVLIFCIVVLFMVIYYFIPFINRKNYTIVYYTMNLAKTEEVSLFSGGSNFACGFQCESNDAEKAKINDLLNLELKYIYYIKEMDGTYHKDPKDLETHTCTYADFDESFHSQFDYLDLGTQICIGNKDYSIQGIYADQIFSYFEITVRAKDKTENTTKEIERFLFENDCKVRFIYTDVIIDLANYEDPLDQYLNEIFVQLNPTLFIKRNIYFMNQQYTNDDYLMFVFGDDEEPEVKPLYSRYEEYSLYKGLDRFQSQVYQYDYYTKMYVRADLKTTIIKRKYQKFMEFYADSTSLLITIYEILQIIFNYIDTFYGYNAISKKIFFFKDVENSDNFNIKKKINAINELISITDLKKTSENSPFKSESRVSKNIKNAPPRKSQIPLKKEPEKENKITNKFTKKNETKISSYSKGKITEEKKLNKSTVRKKFNDEKYYEGEEDIENYPRYKFNQIGRNKNSGAILNFKYNNKPEYDFSESLGTSIEEDEEYSYDSNQTNRKRRKGKLKIEYSFNIFEIIITQFFRCCMCQRMKIKNAANEKAFNILYKNMDVINYSRNMILFDIINQTVLDDDKRKIINFLSRPVININQKNKYKSDEFYSNYREKDFNKYYDCIQDLVQKPQKEDREIKLISVSNEHLRGFI